MLELVHLYVQGFEAFSLLLFSCFFLVISSLFICIFRMVLGRFSVQSPWSPDLTDLGLWFMLALCLSLVFGSCWVFLWWVFPTSWLSEGQYVPHLLFSIVQVLEGCVGAGSSVCARFWGFSIALFQLFVLNNFFTIYLYFQIGPALTSCGLPSFLHLLLLSVGVSFVGVFPFPGGILMFKATTYSFMW